MWILPILPILLQFNIFRSTGHACLNNRDPYKPKYHKIKGLSQIIIIIIINLFIEGSLISAKALFCLRALFGATWIHSYRRMASLIRTRLSDLCTRREVGTFGEETWGTTVPKDENLPTCAPSGLEPPTYHILGRQHCSVHQGLNNSATMPWQEMFWQKWHHFLLEFHFIIQEKEWNFSW